MEQLSAARVLADAETSDFFSRATAFSICCAATGPPDDLGADLSTTPYSAPDSYTQSAVQLEWDERLDADVHQRSSQPGQVAESEDGTIGAPC